VKNVVAAGECDLRTGGRDIHLVEPELFRRREAAPDAGADPGFLRINRVTEFMRMRIA
jgi:hypothetical protein